MEKGDCVEDQENGETSTELARGRMAASYRYTKERLLEIRGLPCSNERPECLSERYDSSDGVWDPEKWHASLYPSSDRGSPVESFKRDYAEDKAPLKRRIADPRERLKEDDLDVVLSPQRRSFGGGCQGSTVPVPSARRAVSPLENKENESLRLGGVRRIGSGRIMAARGFDRDARGDKDVRERDFKEKRFRRDFGDKRVFSERRRNESYTEEEPEWFSGGPTSQSETIELIGFDEKVLEEDKRRPKRSRKRSESVKEAVECNGLVEEPEMVTEAGADQEVPQGEALQEPTMGEFDFNEFFNLEKTMPGLASMINDVLGEGPVSSSRFSRWFTATTSPSASRSSSLRSTPHEELEKLAGLDPHCTSPSHGVATYFTPIQSVERREKVDILALLNKAKIDLKPLLSSLSVNKEKLRESTQSGVVLSLEEVEGGLKALKVEEQQQDPQRQAQEKQEPHGGGTPFMAEHLEKALTGRGRDSPRPRDTDMSAFNKLVSSMKQPSDLPLALTEPQVPPAQQKNILQELLGPQGLPRGGSPTLLNTLLGSPDSGSGRLRQGVTSPPLFPQRAPSPDYYTGRVQPPAGFTVGAQPLLPEQFAELSRPLSPGPTPQQMRALSLGVDPSALDALALQRDLTLQARQLCHPGLTKLPQDKPYRSRQPRMNRSPGPGALRAGSGSPGSVVTSMLSPSFTPTSVIRKMYETKEKNRDEAGSRPESKEGVVHAQEDGNGSPSSFLEGIEGRSSPAGGARSGFPRSACSTPLSSQPRHSKDSQQSASGHHTPVLSPGPASPFPRTIYPVPLLSHMPLGRPPPPQVHPTVVQRMLAQGIQPQQLPPTLLPAGMFPQGVDLSQGLPQAVLGQPFYTLGTAGYPLVPPRAGNPLPLTVLQQPRPVVHTAVSSAPPPSSLPQSQGPHRTAPSQRRAGSPQLGLAKWFSTDVLQQPLPSMPAKVISVDELEFGQ